MKIGIIGTAGRKEDAAKLTAKHVEYMIQIALMHVSSKDTVVSGGAAWADHTAVLIRPHCARLFLQLPCKWDVNKRAYHDTNINNFQTNPGGTSNYYHRLFSKKWAEGFEPIYKNNFNSLEQLHECYLEAHKPGINPSERSVIWCDNFKGFFDRNLQVGKVDKLIAFTFNKGSIPKDGGTKHTWDNSNAPIKLHFDLGTV